MDKRPTNPSTHSTFYKKKPRSFYINSQEMYEYQLSRSLNKSDSQLLQDHAQKILYESIIKSHKKKYASDWTKLRFIPMNPIVSMAVSPCGIFVLFGENLFINILNIPRKHQEPYLKAPNLTSLYFSPNGEYVLCGYPNFLEILNFKEKTLNSRIPISWLMHCKAIFTADGEFVAYPKNNSLLFWSFFDKKEEFRLIGHEKDVLSIECSADGRFIISGSQDGSIILWNFESRRQEFKFIGIQQQITTVEISNNGMYAASIFKFTLTVWNLHTKSEVFTLRAQHDFRSASFSHDSQILAIFDEKYLKLVNIESKRVEKIEKNDNYMKSFGRKITFTPDSKILIVDSICLLKTSRIPKQIINIRSIDTDIISEALITNNRKYIGRVSSSQGLKIYNMEEKRIEFNLSEIKERIILIEVSEDSLYLLTLDQNNLKVFNLKTNEIIFCVFYLLTKFKRFPISKNFAHVAILTNYHIISIWNIMKKIKIFDVEIKIIHISAASFSNDGRFIAIGFADGYIGVWNIDFKCKEYSLNNIFIYIHDIYFKDQKSIIIDADNKYNKREVYFWNILDEAVEFFIKDYQHISINEKYIMTFNDNTLNIWNSKGKFNELSIYCGSIPDKIFYDGKRLSLFYKYHCDIWKIQDYLKIKRINNHQKAVPISFSKNKKFAVCGDEKVLKLWDVNKETKILSFKAHKNWIRTISFSNDSQFILSGDDDGCVKIWDLNGNEIQCFKDHSSWIIAAAFSKDDRFVVSVSNDRVFSFWKVGKSEKLISFEAFEQVISSLCITSSEKFIAVVLIEGDTRVLKV